MPPSSMAHTWVLPMEDAEEFVVETPKPQTPKLALNQMRIPLPSNRAQLAAANSSAAPVKTGTTAQKTPAAVPAVAGPPNSQSSEDGENIPIVVTPVVADSQKSLWWKEVPDDCTLQRCGLISGNFRALQVQGKAPQPAKGNGKVPSTAFAAWAVLACLGPMKLDAIRTALWKNSNWGEDAPKNQTIRKALSKGLNFISDDEYWRLRNVTELVTPAHTETSSRTQTSSRTPTPPRIPAQAQAQARAQTSAWVSVQTQIPAGTLDQTPVSSGKQKQRQKRAAEGENFQRLHRQKRLKLASKPRELEGESVKGLEEESREPSVPCTQPSKPRELEEESAKRVEEESREPPAPCTTPPTLTDAEWVIDKLQMLEATLTLMLMRRGAI